MVKITVYRKMGYVTSPFVSLLDKSEAGSNLAAYSISRCSFVFSIVFTDKFENIVTFCRASGLVSTQFYFVEKRAKRDLYVAKISFIFTDSGNIKCYSGCKVFRIVIDKVAIYRSCRMLNNAYEWCVFANIIRRMERLVKG